MTRLEQRPMTAEEKRAWQQTMRNERSKGPSRCATCGKPAPRILGDLQTGTRYCADHFEIPRQRRDRNAMRRS